ncbi:hypothetical protein KR222_009612 [Zaprionus bogoriensis]|nr:hypothetical protein KR222_009612 [Zaprionus bogoriensis]
MKRLNIFGAFQALAGPGTKEDIIIQVAKQQNIRFNELPTLQKEVDHALDESMRLGFIDRHGAIYKLNMEFPPPPCPNNSPKNTQNMAQVEQVNSRQMHGQGDGNSNISMCCTCNGVEPRNAQDRRRSSVNLEKQLFPDDVTSCSVCGLTSDILQNTEEQDTDKCMWSDMRALL